ncbi:MAG: tRNA (adenosine(37)-N6)-threonylcarbamoyltransferase complex ATPase subunit type 1 TsaE [Desulfitobacteriaceae bacterium]|nr:tRNA (adenosine(37)-N6)-threonylcarbamoyltransferase complex ATPase subunit type 1 TsaE [Desulfitobacteriaceae bacterium]MDD4345442.1 tRNA (adenosine(37)-N6)-threonylcarbamoyltransferase complex ATPase subunit type 1 TsaE [Desulfitobacteriaceae bacterium]MDD4400711.1 tRNA (adenosine(37)-N6)-threonylcarbamoyltransferase complex ATPase subunit type 1 TsaE [Desulfitobacteriaceae bacterium]
MELTVWSKSAQETNLWGQRLGSLLCGGDVVCLAGDLGSGKTALAQGAGRALKVTVPMTSPTFTLIQEYYCESGGKELHLVHMDLYRLQEPEEIEVIGVMDYFREETICLIEWPEIALDYLPDDILEVRIEGNGEMPRKITFRSWGGDWGERFRGLKIET